MPRAALTQRKVLKLQHQKTNTREKLNKIKKTIYKIHEIKQLDHG